MFLTMRYKIKFIAALLLMPFATVVFAEIYSWKDKDGAQHFSDQNPENNTSTVLQVTPTNISLTEETIPQDNEVEGLEEISSEKAGPENADPENASTAKKKTPHGDLKLIPMTLRAGIEGNKRFKNADDIFKDKSYLKYAKQATLAGIKLSAVLDREKIADENPKTGNAFSLFFNKAEAKSCQREFLIQRVKLTKTYMYAAEVAETQGKQKITSSYLVEMMKLNKEKMMIGIDAHYRGYALDGMSKRKLLVEVEIGCGVIKDAKQKKLSQKKLSQNSWPYEPKKSYHLIHSYITDPAVYDNVKFEFSRQYQFEFEFDAMGEFAVEWPYFLNKS